MSEFDELAHEGATRDARGRFVNRYGPPRRVDRLKYLGWALRYLSTRKPIEAVEWHRLEPAPYRLAAEVGVTWLGHAGVHVATPALDLLFDPLLPRPWGGRPPGKRALFDLTMPQLGGRPVVVVISHDHFDHLSRASVSHLARALDCRFVVPLGVELLLRRWGIDRCVALDWWQAHRADGLELTCCPANHWSGRRPGRTNSSLWASWSVELAGARLFFGGDTGAGRHHREIGERLGPVDLAALPIGAYAPDWLHAAHHLNPEEALDAMDMIGARRLLPIHWGTLDISDEPPHEPYARLIRAARRRGQLERIVSLRP